MDEEEAPRPDQADAELAALRERNRELERQIDEVHEGQLRAELRVEAARAGMIDLDGLKLLPPEAVRIDAAGGAHGIREAIAGLRREKPWLFAQANSSSTATAPPTQPAAPRLATDMSFAEWRAARAELLKRR